MTGGFWKAPRALVRTLRLHDLTPTEWGILIYLGLAGADREEGIVVTRAELQDAFSCSHSTVSRALRRLRAEGRLAYEDHSGRQGFVVLLGPEPGSGGGSRGESQDAPLVTEVGSVTTSVTPPPAEGREPAPAHGSEASPTSVTTSDTSRAGAKTDTEIENRLAAVPPSGDELAPFPSAQALVAHYVDQMRALNVEPPRTLVGQVAAQVGRLLQEGQDPPVIAAAIRLLTEKRHLGPGALPTLIPEAAAGRGASEHPSERLLRELREGR